MGCGYVDQIVTKAQSTAFELVAGLNDEVHWPHRESTAFVQNSDVGVHPVIGAHAGDKVLD